MGKFRKFENQTIKREILEFQKIVSFTSYCQQYLIMKLKLSGLKLPWINWSFSAKFSWL